MPLNSIHSSWRTSSLASSWFFFKFRSFKETMCFDEPFNEDLKEISREKASSADPQSSDSHHPASDPYYLEYLPLISNPGGVLT